MANERVEKRLHLAWVTLERLFSNARCGTSEDSREHLSNFYFAIGMDGRTR